MIGSAKCFFGWWCFCLGVSAGWCFCWVVSLLGCASAGWCFSLGGVSIGCVFQLGGFFLLCGCFLLCFSRFQFFFQMCVFQMCFSDVCFSDVCFSDVFLSVCSSVSHVFSCFHVFSVAFISDFSDVRF